MNTTVYDEESRLYTLEFDLPVDSDFLRVNVYDKKCRIGYANCMIGDTVMRLEDIHITEDMPVKECWLAGMVRRLAKLKPKTVNYRGRGIGTGVLLAVIQYAREHGMDEVKGQIGHLDWKDNPALPNWYRKHGFSVSESGDISLKLR